MTDPYSDDATFQADTESEDRSYEHAPAAEMKRDDSDYYWWDQRVDAAEYARRDVSPKTRTPREWEQITGIKILDPDGWRYSVHGDEFDKIIPARSFIDEITKEEFDIRASQSTCIWPPLPE